MKLRIISFAIIALGVSLMVSCKDESKNEVTPAQTEAESTNSNTTPTLNPEHGQPGHRCEIPVGAPLDQAAGNTTIKTPSPVSTGVSPVWSSDAAPVKNPPHGQPGHDCAVPVGADLKK